jgi:hypothetical protein
VDDGSGCVSTMMLAKAAANLTFEKTVHFMCVPFRSAILSLLFLLSSPSQPYLSRECVLEIFLNVCLLQHAHTHTQRCFGGEEQGLYGSAYYANLNGTNVLAAITADMISYGKRGVIIEGTTNSDIQRLMNLCESNARAYSPLMNIVRSNNSFGSDHGTVCVPLRFLI